MTTNEITTTAITPAEIGGDSPCTHGSKCTIACSWCPSYGNWTVVINSGQRLGWLVDKRRQQLSLTGGICASQEGE